MRSIDCDAFFSQLKERGIEGVSPQQISNEKAKLRKKIRKSKMEETSLSAVKKVKALADELGSLDAIKRAIVELEQLRK